MENNASTARAGIQYTYAYVLSAQQYKFGPWLKDSSNIQAERRKQTRRWLNQSSQNTQTKLSGETNKMFSVC